jgi:hypothetical protein
MQMTEKDADFMATRKPREAECREGAGYMITRYAHERQLQ